MGRSGLFFSVLLCGKDGRWKTKLEELLQPNQVDEAQA